MKDKIKEEKYNDMNSEFYKYKKYMCENCEFYYDGCTKKRIAKVCAKKGLKNKD